MARRLFCEISPLTYEISVAKMRLMRHAKNLRSRKRFAQTKAAPLPVLLYSYKSLIRRKLGNVDMTLQENKAVNLSLAAPKVSGVVIRPGETFSFWQLVGPCPKRQGYREGLTITAGTPTKGIGGGMCQFTNLLHWLTLHSPLEITEHHHHDGYDLFPDYGRQIPFGCGTSILYNYLDYQVANHTAHTFQFIVYTNETYLCGELRVSEAQPCAYHIIEEDAHFVRRGEDYFRRNRIFQQVVDKVTGNEQRRTLLKQSHAKVLYDAQFIDPALLREES